LKRRKVAFALDAVAHYREDFFAKLRDNLEREAIDISLVTGSGYSGHNIGASIPWAQEVRLRQVGRLSWLPAGAVTRSADLLIVAQVLKHVFLYHAAARHLMGTQKIALFGHGKLFSARPEHPLAARLKQWISRQCDWWFAYTERSAEVVRNEIGFPSERITIVNNAIDTAGLSRASESLRPEVLPRLRAELGIASENVGIFVGGMYDGPQHTKRLPFLIASCQEIRARVPDFQMIFVGGGPAQDIVEQAAGMQPWIHYVGVKKGAEAVPYWRLAKVCLNPGLVGLGILDAFALGVPLITSDIPYHSPEIAYLKPDRNGVIVDDCGEPSVYAETVVRLMSDAPRRAALIAEARRDAAALTTEAMVDNFSDGILRALAL